MKSLERLRSIPWHALSGLEAALEPALDEVLGGAAADRVLDRFLRRHREASAEQRTAIAEAVFGVGLWRRRLRAAQPTGTSRALLQLLIDGSSDPASFADRFSLPDWLAQTIQREAGAEAEAFADSLNLPGPICLRANALRISRDDLAQRLSAAGVETRPGAWAAHSLIITTPRPNLYGLEAWNQGLFEVQDEGSQLLGELVDAHPGDEVIDLCAGAGGKTLQLAAQVGNQGRVHAMDVDLSRLERLRTRAARAGATCISIHGKALPDSLRASYVLVDAPCSELGALRRGPDLRWRIDPAGFAAFPPLQRELLDLGVRHLAPGGRLVYATCTFRREENEALVCAFEQAHPELVRARPAIDARLLDAEGFFRTFPQRHGTDSFFASVHTGQIR